MRKTELKRLRHALMIGLGLDACECHNCVRTYNAGVLAVIRALSKKPKKRKRK